MNTHDGRRVVFLAANASVDRMYEVKALLPGTIHRPTSVVAVPGGKGLNAARAAAQLGATVSVVGIVGGRTGDWIVDRLTERRIPFDLVRSVVETRTCVSILDEASSALTELYETGSRMDPSEWTSFETKIAGALDDDVGLVAMSGSLPLGAAEDGYAGLAAAILARGIPVAVDTSGDSLRATLAARPTILKVNSEEAGGVSGVRVDSPRAAVVAGRALRALGARSVIVTLGRDGAVLVAADAEVHLRSPAVAGPYSVGSGDSFLGGLATAIVRGDALLDAARLGIAAGVANTLRPGPGEFDPDLAHRAAREVLTELMPSASIDS